MRRSMCSPPFHCCACAPNGVTFIKWKAVQVRVMFSGHSTLRAALFCVVPTRMPMHKLEDLSVSMS